MKSLSPSLLKAFVDALLPVEVEDAAVVLDTVVMTFSSSSYQA
jgi:hypothetical protein